MFNTAPIGIYRTTPEGNVIDANPVVVQMLGCSSLEELVERNLEIEGIDANYSRNQFKKELEKNGQIIGLESEWTTRIGEKKFIRENAKMIKSSSGEVLYYDGTIEDITDRKNIENSLRNREKQYRVLFENNPCPSWVYDSESLSFLAVNKAAIEHYGYTKEEFDKLTVKDIRPVEEIARFISYVEEEKKSESNVWYWKHCKKDGTILM
ncbi:MAG: PAS domain-containing protein [Blastocatellia bacterium]|nr:PAS domain-containing protein [Blastocatellia bacterium]